MDNALLAQLKRSEIITYAGQKANRHFTDNHSINDFIGDLLRAVNIQDIHTQCILICEHYGFDFFALAEHLHRPNQPPLFFRMLEHINPFSIHYEKKAFLFTDPTIRIATQRTTPYIMSNDINSYGGELNLDRKEVGLIHDAMDFGMREVFYAPFHGYFGGFGLVRFMHYEGGRATLKDRAKPLHIQAELFLLASFIHENLIRLLVINKNNILLTEREKQILQLVAGGKNPSRIGDILSISDNTVCNHLKNIRTKLGVKNTTHAVAKALSEHLIIV